MERETRVLSEVMEMFHISLGEVVSQVCRIIKFIKLNTEDLHILLYVKCILIKKIVFFNCQPHPYAGAGNFTLTELILNEQGKQN